jgi:uncharacterized Zn finger protein
MRLYYWPADRRIHLLGAEAGTLTVDYDYDGKTGMEIEYRDDDGDGFLDCREVTTRSPAQKRIVEKGSAPSQTIALDYGEISAIWPGALKETVAAQEDLLKALSTILGRPSLVGGPVDFYENATEKQFRAAGRMRQSVEARRYYQDVEIELIFAALLEKYPEPRKGLSITRAILERARRLADQGSLREAAGLLKKSGP